MAVDPGGSTGFVNGVFDLKAKSLKECLQYAPWVSDTITGTEVQQAAMLCTAWEALVRLPADRAALVMEDYIQQPTMHVVDPESLMPIRVAWCMIGMLASGGLGASNVRLNFQGPGERMPESRLKGHGAWIVGRPHERAAMGHLLTFLSARLK